MNDLMAGIIDAFMNSDPVEMNEANIFIEPTASINRINKSVQLTGRINEADCRIVSPVPTSEANCSNQLNSVNKADIEANRSLKPANKGNVGPTIAMKEAAIEPNCSLQLLLPFNKENIEPTAVMFEDIESNCSLQLLSPVKKENIEPTATKKEADIETNSFLHVTHSIDVTEILIEPTVSSIKEIIQPNCSSQLISPGNIVDFEPTATKKEADIETNRFVDRNSPIDVSEILIVSKNKVNIEPKSSLQLILPVSKVDSKTTSVKNEADVEPTAEMNEGIESNVSVNLTSADDLMDMAIQPTALINRLAVESNSCVRLTVPTKSTNNNNTTALVDKSATIITNEFQEALEIFKWIETKLDLLKIIQNNEENQEYPKIAKNELLSDKRSVLQEILEETRKMGAKTVLEESSYLSKEVMRMLDMLQETTLGLLKTLDRSESRCPSIKVLSTIILHLSSSIGSKITFQDIQNHINGEHILQLYDNVQISREPKLTKMANFKRYIEHGVKKAQVLKRKSTPLKNKIELAIVKCSDAQNVNETLKDLGRESEDLLLKYADLVRYLMTKARSFVTMKNDSERVLGQFITKEIPDMYNE